MCGRALLWLLVCAALIPTSCCVLTAAVFHWNDQLTRRCALQQLRTRIHAGAHLYCVAERCS